MDEEEGMDEGVGRGEKKENGGGRIIEQVSVSASAYHISEKSVALTLNRLIPETEIKSISTAGFMGKPGLFSGDMAEGKKTVVSECSMCGDVGFVQDLLLCKRCGYRLQHTYCSKLYPYLDMEKWACEWCLFEEENSDAAKAKVGKRKSESRSKAFEFLLQIAQASPTSDRQKQREGVRVNGFASREENGFKCGAVKIRKAEQRPRYFNAFKFGHLWENCKEDKDGIKSGGQMVKKQRCSHTHQSNKALDNWRNLGKSKLYCSNTSSKAIGRRYKLLAD
ncbi:hypothetical protein KI387_041203, partial [Taxus chinensis]